MSWSHEDIAKHGYHNSPETPTLVKIVQVSVLLIRLIQSPN